MSEQITTQVVGKGITPEMPVEVPKEALDIQFKMDSTLLSGDSGASTITSDGKPIVEEPKNEEIVEPKKEEPKKEEPSKSVLKAPATTAEEPKKEVPSKTPSAKIPGKTITPLKERKESEDNFDYTKYSPQEVTNLKNMSRQSREYAAKLIDDNKQLAGLKDSTYLQHEQGYTLSPAFQEIQKKDYYIKTEAKCWEQALLDLKSGKPVKEITGFDGNGNPLFSEERIATDADEIRISNNLTTCLQAAKQVDEHLRQYPNQFKQRIEQDLQAINRVQAEKFAWVGDPKLLDYSVNVEGQGEQKLRDIKNNFKSMFPAYQANNIGVEVASNLMVALIIQEAELREARNGQQVAQIKQKEAARGEPTSDAFPSEATKLEAKGIPSVFTLDGFPSR
jgi:hypothetical protein